MKKQLNQFGKRKIRVRAVFDVLMGLIYALVGVFLLAAEFMGKKLAFPPKEFIWVFGSLSFLYGVFRIYRGIVSFYQNEA
jgi:hypothetical protein